MLAQRSAACAATLLLACASALSASDTTFVSEGARVKLFPTQPGAKAITGNVTDLVSDTLVIVPEGGGEALTFDRRDLRKIEVSQGNKGNALLGLGVGAGVGIGLALAGCSADNWTYCDSTESNGEGAYAAIGAVLFGAIGAGAGALIKTERWKEADFPASPAVALNIGKDGSVRLALSLRL